MHSLLVGKLQAGRQSWAAPELCAALQLPWRCLEVDGSHAGSLGQKLQARPTLGWPPRQNGQEAAASCLALCMHRPAVCHDDGRAYDRLGGANNPESTACMLKSQMKPGHC